MLETVLCKRNWKLKQEPKVRKDDLFSIIKKCLTYLLLNKKGLNMFCFEESKVNTVIINKDRFVELSYNISSSGFRVCHQTQAYLTGSED